ncbi:MAG: sugar phosphate nucleotidyltransferase [Candidatus Magasanikbacteria bacterium]
MTILIFAGGSGTRLWPLSRRNNPKQFEILKDDRSTLQMAIDRVKEFGLEHVYISTNDTYTKQVMLQVPEFAPDHILGEPERRDLAAAVGLALLRLKRQGVEGTIAMLWADHFMDNVDNFIEALQKAQKLIDEDKNRFVFLGEQPRFANQNLGWIHIGDHLGGGVHQFLEWKYRPDLLDCQEMFESQMWLWNPGYFVFDMDFVLGLYKQHQPQMYIALEDMVRDEKNLQEEYPKLDMLSFDEAIVEKVDPSQAVVLRVNLGWSDPGTLYALKESLVKEKNKNFEKGNVVDLGSEDSFIVNDDNTRLVGTIGLRGMVVVSTKDATLVCHKDDVPKVKELLKKIEEQGKEKYL